MEIPLLAGRGFTETVATASVPVAIINGIPTTLDQHLAGRLAKERRALAIDPAAVLKAE